MRAILATLVSLLGVWVTAAAPELDFKLMDENASSPRAHALVSPRDYLLQVSGYYFGAAH